MLNFIYGIVIGAALMRLAIGLQAGELVAHWYFWPLGLATFLLGTLALQTLVASFQEREPRAGWVSLAILGVPTLLLGWLAALSVGWS